jgi:hypothetical protein
MPTNNTNPLCEPLRVSGDTIVNAASEHIVLMGKALGRYLNMGNFITAYADHEHEHGGPLSSVLSRKEATYSSIGSCTTSSLKLTQSLSPR